MNKLNKNKSPIAIEEEIKKKTQCIFDEFIDFTDGYRVLFLIYRNKDGGPTNNGKVRKIITRNKEEFFKGLESLIRDQYESPLPLRIYSSVNERNFEKAIRQFKYEQLDSDYYDTVQKENFYLDIKNRFLGCLMQPAQRKTSLFMFDIDQVPEEPDVTAKTLRLLPSDVIIKQYRTKAGWHIITSAFNYTEITLPKNVEFKKDGLLLLSY